MKVVWIIDFERKDETNQAVRLIYDQFHHASADFQPDQIIVNPSGIGAAAADKLQFLGLPAELSRKGELIDAVMTKAFRGSTKSDEPPKPDCLPPQQLVWESQSLVDHFERRKLTASHIYEVLMSVLKIYWPNYNFKREG